MTTEHAPPTRLERIVDVLVKGVILLWVGGLGLVLINSWLVHRHPLSVIGVAALQTGLLFVIIIVVSVMASGARKKGSQ